MAPVHSVRLLLVTALLFLSCSDVMAQMEYAQAIGQAQQNNMVSAYGMDPDADGSLEVSRDPDATDGPLEPPTMGIRRLSRLAAQKATAQYPSTQPQPFDFIDRMAQASDPDASSAVAATTSTLQQFRPQPQSMSGQGEYSVQGLEATVAAGRAQVMGALETVPGVQALQRFTTALVSQNQNQSGGGGPVGALMSILMFLCGFAFSLMFPLYIPCGIPPVVAILEQQEESMKGKWMSITYEHKPGGAKQGEKYSITEILTGILYYLLKIRKYLCKLWIVPYFSEKPDPVLQPAFMSGPRRVLGIVCFFLFFMLLG